VYLGGPATVGAGPLMCTDSWAVTLWRTASAARLRRSRSHRAVRGHPDTTSTAPLWLLSRPSLAYGPGPGRGRCPGRPIPCAPVAGPPTAPSEATVLPLYATSPGQWHPLLRQGLADSDGARGAGSRGHRDQRSRYATSRTLAPPSRACTSMTASLEPRHHLGPRPLNPAAGVNTHTPP
jgi:hypothetical protein